MKIQPVGNYNIAQKGAPKSQNVLNNTVKSSNIDSADLASVFEKFEKDFRTTMETFVYMVKNVI